MNSDNAISSCHLLDWAEMGWAWLGGGMGVGGEEKGEGIAGSEDNVG
jgi:hypothetical protein